MWACTQMSSLLTTLPGIRKLKSKTLVFVADSPASLQPRDIHVHSSERPLLHRALELGPVPKWLTLSRSEAPPHVCVLTIPCRSRPANRILSSNGTNRHQPLLQFDGVLILPPPKGRLMVPELFIRVYSAGFANAFEGAKLAQIGQK